MNLKAQEYREKLRSLVDFIDSKTVFQEDELLGWVLQCVSLFTELKINDEIIRGFMDTFEFDISEDHLKKIGPFFYHYDWDKEKESGYSLRGILIHFKYPSQDIYYVNLAFNAIAAVIRNIEDENRLVIKPIINSLSKFTEYKHIVSSLELMEKYYQDKDADGLIKNSLTLLDSIFELEQQLSSKDLCNKLRTICADIQLMKNFGISKELVFALDNDRLIRNVLTHKKLPIKLNIPFLVSLGCAYLVIMVLESAMYAGVYFKVKIV